MKAITIEKNNKKMVHVLSNKVLITDVQSAIDFAMSVQYETGCDRIVIAKESLTKDFFILSTKLAGEILQKYINYHIKLAIYGDFSGYTSKPLKDFIYESNKGEDFFFTRDLETALEKLSEK